jgi:hypothetical protein
MWFSVKFLDITTLAGVISFQMKLRAQGLSYQEISRETYELMRKQFRGTLHLPREFNQCVYVRKFQLLFEHAPYSVYMSEVLARLEDNPHIKLKPRGPLTRQRQPIGVSAEPGFRYC